jgi:hypothetical protein
LDVVKTAVKRYDENLKEPQKYLVYTPWEQFNNQILGFKSACALASFLNRTLVLPLVGQPQTAVHNRKMFDPLEYEWTSFDLYFDIPSLKLLPCSTISSDNFYSLFRDKSLGTLRYHHVSDEATSESQIKNYYKTVMDLKYEKVEWDLGITYGLSDAELYDLHSRDNSTVLALGSMFWYYNFGISVEYPMTKFYAYLNDPLYNQITRGLSFSERLLKIADVLLGRIKKPYVSFHFRSGDYAQKCAEMIQKDPNALRNPDIYSGMSYYLTKNPKAAWKSNITWPIFDSCFTPLFWIKKKIQPLKNISSTLFVSTNAEALEKIEIAHALPEFKVYYMEDILHAADPVRSCLNSVDLSILDQLLSINAAHFVGNLYSSFSRAIIESRSLQGRESSVF